MAYDPREQMQFRRLPSGVFFNARKHEAFLEAKDRQQGHEGRGSLGALHCRDFRVAETWSKTSSDDDQRLYLPLLEVSLDVEVVATTARTRLTQNFTNQSASLIPEAKYCFPLYDGSAVHEFRCWIGNDKLLQGKIQPKDTAKAEYQEAVSRQRVAALLEEHTPEVFETSIGNIPSQTTIKVEILYITELKADLGGDGVLVTIPTSVAPRYGTPPVEYSLNSGIGSTTTPAENGLKIQIEVSAPHPIRKLESRTHPISVELGAEGHPTSTSTFRDLAARTSSAGFDPNKARAKLSDRCASLGKDFVLLILSSGPSLLASRALIEPHPTIPDHSAMMVTITPRELFASNLSLNKVEAEIVLVADRSGSMQDKLETLQTAMRVFIKSIPEKCYFNICSFGSHHSLLWSQSRPCTQRNVDMAYQHVSNSFQADMGGTELLSALESVVQQRTTKDLNTQIIILTDGEVWNTENTIDFVRQTRRDTAEKVSFFALGIGDAVSHRLVEGIGREGGGLAEVVAVDAPGRWESRVIRMLKGALTPSRWQCEITLGDGSTSSIPLQNLYSKFHQEPSADMPVQAPAYIRTPYRIPILHAFSRLSIFFFLNHRALGAFKSVTIQGMAATGETVNVTLPLEHVQTEKPTIHFLAAKSLMNDLETGQSWLHDDKSTSYQKQNPAAFEQAIRQEGENIGKQWSIAGKWTSFVAVDRGSQIENIIQIYRAERSELADLTMSRYHATSAQDLTCLGFSSMQSPTGASQPAIYRIRPRESAVALNYPESESSSLGFARASSRESTWGTTSHSMGGSWKSSWKSGGAKLGWHTSRYSPAKSPASSILVDLIDAQKSDGSFALKTPLRVKLLDKFSNNIFSDMLEYLKTIDTRFLLSWIFPQEKVCETVLVIVYIKSEYAESAELWELVVQKASGWLQQQMQNESVRSALHAMAQSSLRNGLTSASDEKTDGNKDSKMECGDANKDSNIKCGDVDTRTEDGDATSASQHIPESASSDHDGNE